MPIFQHTAKEENAAQGNTGRHGYISGPLQIHFCGGFPMRILSQALSGFLSGFYFARMFYRPAIKKPFTGVLEA